MTKLFFDLDLLTGPKYGIAYAVLEQMHALQKLGINVNNFAIGWRGLLEHKQQMQKEGFATLSVPFSKKILTLLNYLPVPLEQYFLDGYDYFLQIGLHAFRKIPAKKYILAIHDTVGLRYPQEEAPFPEWAGQMLAAANKIITVSEFSKKEILHFFKLDPNKIQVVPNGCNFERFNLQNDLAELAQLRQKYNLPEKYFLAYGGNAPRKNINFLAQVFTELTETIPLVICGGFQLNGPAKNILQLGYLPEKEIELILKNAFAFILPSYYEGFGLPVLEAMCCGIPVLCSDQAALPEVAGTNALFFDPFKPAELKEKIHVILTDEPLRQKMIAAGLEWGKRFSWEKSATALLAALRK